MTASPTHPRTGEPETEAGRQQALHFHAEDCIAFLPLGAEHIADVLDCNCGVLNGILAIEAEAAKRERDRIALTKGVELIGAERRRQIEHEGYGPRHDAKHTADTLAEAGAAYVLIAAMRKNGFGDGIPGQWPWSHRDWKPAPNDRLRELVKAGALIAAAIDRLTPDPAEGSPDPVPDEPPGVAVEMHGK